MRGLARSPERCFPNCRRGDADEHVTGSAKAFHLPRKHLPVAVVVAHRRQDRGIRGQCYRRKSLTLDFEAADDLRGKVLGITGAAAVAADEQLAARQQAGEQRLPGRFDGRCPGGQLLHTLDVLIEHGAQHDE